MQVIVYRRPDKTLLVQFAVFAALRAAEQASCSE